MNIVTSRDRNFGLQTILLNIGPLVLFLTDAIVTPSMLLSLRLLVLASLWLKKSIVEPL
jgi:hypothetical protein